MYDLYQCNESDTARFMLGKHGTRILFLVLAVRKSSVKQEWGQDLNLMLKIAVEYPRENSSTERTNRGGISLRKTRCFMSYPFLIYRVFPLRVTLYPFASHCAFCFTADSAVLYSRFSLVASAFATIGLLY
jgi:hypothetical protein